MLRSPFVSTEGVAKKGGRAFWPVTFDSQPPVVSEWSVPLPQQRPINHTALFLCLVKIYIKNYIYPKSWIFELKLS